LKYNVYCRVGVSTVNGAGVGLIAIRDIPKGVYPLRVLGSRSGCSSTVKIHYDDIYSNSGIPKSVLKLVNDFMNCDENRMVDFSIMGINQIYLEYFLNHSSNPNVAFFNGEVKTIRKIKTGQELFVDYGTCFKNDFYRK